MPFGGWFDEYWRDIYSPAITAAGLSAKRADDIFRAGVVMRDVWEFTQTAKVLLADLATRNINVFYELGLAHATGKPVVLVSDSIDDVPFDLRGLRVLLYDRNNPQWGSELRVALTAALRDTIREPLAAVPTAFVNNRPENRQQPDLPQDARDLIQVKQDVEFLKREFAASQLSSDPSKQLPLPQAFLRAHTRFPVVPSRFVFDSPDEPEDDKK